MGAVTLAAVALSVSPAHLSLAAGSRATVHVRGGEGLILHAGVAGLALDASGRPRIVARRDAGPWLSVRPRTVTIDRSGATLVVEARRPSGARPGDHSAIVLLTETARTRRAIAVGLRIGLVVTVRVAGTRVSRLEVIGARVTRTPQTSVFAVTIANRGNVIEAVGGTRLQLTLVRDGHVIARLRAPRRALLPRTHAVVRLHCRATVRGAVVVRIVLPSTRRSFRLRL